MDDSTKKEQERINQYMEDNELVEVFNAVVNDLVTEMPLDPFDYLGAKFRGLSGGIGQIVDVRGRELFSSSGLPTIEIEITTSDGVFSSIAPCGVSKCINEAEEVYDQSKSRYNGHGTLNMRQKVKEIIAPALIGRNVRDQIACDDFLEGLEGSPTRANFGANTLCALSMAVCRAGAAAKRIPLYQHIGDILRTISKRAGQEVPLEYGMPMPNISIVDGGEHADSSMCFESLFVVPLGAESFDEALQLGWTIHNKLYKTATGKRKFAVGSGVLGGIVPSDDDAPRAMLQMIKETIADCGLQDKVKIGINVASDSFYNKSMRKYDMAAKALQSNLISKMELLSLYRAYMAEFGLCSIQDPFHCGDGDGFFTLADEIDKFDESVCVVAGDLFASNPEKIETWMKRDLCHAAAVKISQAGTVTAACNAVCKAREHGLEVTVSGRGLESEDDFLADFAVGVRAFCCQFGAPVGTAHCCKYNRLIRIEDRICADLTLDEDDTSAERLCLPLFKSTVVKVKAEEVNLEEESEEGEGEKKEEGEKEEKE